MRDLLKFGTNQPAETRLKTVLVINYSQTGQLAEITEQVISPLRAAGHQVHRRRHRALVRTKADQ